MILNDIGAGFCCIYPPRPDPKHETRIICSRFKLPAAVSGKACGVPRREGDKDRSICTADELHRVSVSNSDWKLALWRYLPSPKVPLFPPKLSTLRFLLIPFCNAIIYLLGPFEESPALLLSGVATNAIGYDLSRGTCHHKDLIHGLLRFECWVSTCGNSLEEDEECLKNLYGIDSAINDGKINASSSRALGFKNLGASFESEVPNRKRRVSEVEGKYEELPLTPRFMEIFTRISDRLTGFLSRGERNPAIVSQIKNINRRLRAIIEGQQFFPEQIFELQDRLTAPLEELQKQLELIVKYDWDFDHYLEEDVPAAGSMPTKGWKLLAIGHSMGGILLYAKLSRCCFDGKDSGLASVVTWHHHSTIHLQDHLSSCFYPWQAEPVQALNIPVIPVGPLIATAYPLRTILHTFILAKCSDFSSRHDGTKLLEKLV
ncbi:hypothetical protein SESBI_45190 [Sesbania bispinosa]|nr:hypothetical protein SESBI_45190 [Sesbania bispinosa]